MPWERDLHSGQLALARGVYNEAERFLLLARDAANALGPGDTAWAEVNRALAKLYLAMGKAKQAEVAATEALSTDEMYWGVECEQVAEDCYLIGESLRQQWDFERARGWFQRALNFRERYFTVTHASTMEVLSRMLLVYLQANHTFGLEPLHAKTFQAYQATHPSGMWAKFLILHEVAQKYLDEGKKQELVDLFRTETNLLRKQLGANHREVASVLEVEAELLKTSKQQLAAWSVGAKATHVEKANNLSLFAGVEKTYRLPAPQVEDAIVKLLTHPVPGGSDAPVPIRGARWRIATKMMQSEPTIATLCYEDGAEYGGIGLGAGNNAELKLTVRCQPRGPMCSVMFEWQLFNSSNQNLARAITNYTIKDLDDNLTVMPPVALPTGFGAGSPFGGGITGNAFGGAGSDWPTPQQFNEAVQNPSSAFADIELRQSEAEVNAIGLPKPYSGAFATVYKMCGTAADVAVKCFTTKVPDQQSRYAAISEELSRLGLSYFTKFEYLNDGITISGGHYPILKMDWLHGQPINAYIEANLRNPERLSALASKFLSAVAAMQSHGIAHGDLQHGNIIIVGEDVRFVDYDGMYVPSLSGHAANELGHRNYQHPARGADFFNDRLDNFSTWVIYCSLICLSRRPQIWDLLDAGEESLLFKHGDFQAPDQSKAFRLLTAEVDPDIKATMHFFSEIVRMRIDQLPSVAEVFPNAVA